MYLMKVAISQQMVFLTNKIPVQAQVMIKSGSAMLKSQISVITRQWTEASLLMYNKLIIYYTL